LTELKWGRFEAMGFGGLDPAEKKLQFDLTESARTIRLDLGSVVLLMFTYRVVVAGVETNDAHLDGFLVHWIPSHRRATDTLQFSTHLVNSISSWPEQQADIARKLKKTQRVFSAFRWDIEPVMDTEVIIDEALMDVFCDLMYDGGWMEIEPEEGDRECDWALMRATV